MSWYHVDVPKNIVARPGDAVSYYAINNKTQNKTSHLSQACYAAHMGMLPQNTFDCVPNNTKTSILPPEDFFLWMKFCAAFGFSPSGTIPYTKGEMNCCIIHGEGECRHRIYAGLCCYRWAECLSPLVYEACRLIEKRPDISFYRIVHYITGKYVTLIGHSFTNVSAASMSAYCGGGKSPRLDHMWGLYPKFFFGPGHNLAVKSNGVVTQSTLATDIQKFNLNLTVKKHEDLLDDKWTELYEIEELKKETIKSVYDSLNKKPT